MASSYAETRRPYSGEYAQLTATSLPVRVPTDGEESRNQPLPARTRVWQSETTHVPTRDNFGVSPWMKSWAFFARKRFAFSSLQLQTSCQQLYCVASPTFVMFNC